MHLLACSLHLCSHPFLDAAADGSLKREQFDAWLVQVCTACAVDVS